MARSLVRVRGVAQLAALAALLFSHTTAVAFFETGHTLAPLKDEYRKVAQDVPNGDALMAAEYSGQVIAGYDALIALRMACANGASREQVVEKVTQFLDDNPGTHASPAFELSYLALMGTYACGQPQPKATVANQHAAGNFVDGHRLSKLAQEYVKSSAPDAEFDGTLVAEYRGYVIGVHDALYLGKVICTVADSKEQVLDLVAEHVVGRPVSLDDPGFSLIVDSLIVAGYDCD